MKKGKENGGKLLKNGEKGLKNASFWVINTKQIPPSSITLQTTYRDYNVFDAANAAALVDKLLLHNQGGRADYL